MCRLFEIPVSSYDYQPVEKPDEQAIIEKLNQLHKDHFESYGRRRMTIALQNAEFNICVFRTARLMAEAGAVAKRPKKSYYYVSVQEKPNIPNLLNREFTQPDSGTHWVGGITYIRSHQGWNYLATVLDLGTREIVGYALSRTPDARLVKQALINAIQMKQPNTKKLLFHSDQGVQYCANLFKETLALHGITQSMSRRGNCHDNSVQERFFRNLKTEYLNGMNFINHSSIVTAVEK